jgi:hypothetical protein
MKKFLMTTAICLAIASPALANSHKVCPLERVSTGKRSITSEAVLKAISLQAFTVDCLRGYIDKHWEYMEKEDGLNKSVNKVCFELQWITNNLLNSTLRGTRNRAMSSFHMLECPKRMRQGKVQKIAKP